MAILNTSKSYSPGELAGYAGGMGETWDQKEFFFGGEKYKIRDNGNGTRRLEQMQPTKNDIQSGKAVGDLRPFLVEEVSNQLIELEDKLNKIPGVSLTQQEQDAFLQKAIDQITPYYDAKMAEIQKGIKEGFIRTAEDTLNLIAQVKNEVKTSFQKYDIDEAQTDQEFVEKMADITSAEGEAVDAKKFEWAQRLEDARATLGKKGILSSGIGQKQISDLKMRMEDEKAAIARRAEQAKTEATTVKKFSLDRVALARQQITDERKRRIGDPDQTAAMEAKARADAGLSTDQNLSEADILNRRQERNTKVYDPTALTALGEERSQAQESRFISLKQEETDKRLAQEKSQREAINSQIAAKQRELQNVRGY